jgi:hypothetical protein
MADASPDLHYFVTAKLADDPNHPETNLKKKLRVKVSKFVNDIDDTTPNNKHAPVSVEHFLQGILLERASWLLRLARRKLTAEKGAVVVLLGNSIQFLVLMNGASVPASMQKLDKLPSLKVSVFITTGGANDSGDLESLGGLNERESLFEVLTQDSNHGQHLQDCTICIGNEEPEDICLNSTMRIARITCPNGLLDFNVRSFDVSDVWESGSVRPFAIITKNDTVPVISDAQNVSLEKKDAQPSQAGAVASANAEIKSSTLADTKKEPPVRYDSSTVPATNRSGLTTDNHRSLFGDMHPREIILLKRAYCGDTIDASLEEADLRKVTKKDRKELLTICNQLDGVNTGRKSAAKVRDDKKEEPPVRFDSSTVPATNRSDPTENQSLFADMHPREIILLKRAYCGDSIDASLEGADLRKVSKKDRKELLTICKQLDSENTGRKPASKVTEDKSKASGWKKPPTDVASQKVVAHSITLPTKDSKSKN